MPFKRAVQRYGQTPQAETPYHKTGQLWDERIGNARVQAANWRLMALGTLTLAGGLAMALVWQSLQSRVVPYVVEVDRLGEARAVTLAQSAYQPSDPQIAWFLARFIKDVRSRSLDPVLMRGDWLQAYDFVSPRGALFLGDYARADDPFARAGEKTVSVEVTSVVRASDRSFQVKWTETTYERGSLAGSTRWTAMLSVALKPPRQADILRKNPLGLYVDAIDWSRELDSAADRPAPGNAVTPVANSRFPVLATQPDAGGPSIGEPSMKTLFLVASLLAGAAAVMAAAPNPAAPPKPNPTPTAAVAAQGAGGPKPALKPELAKAVPAPLAAPAMPAKPAITLPHRRAKPRLTPAEWRVRAANLSAMQEPQVQGFMNALQVYAWSDGVLYHLLTSPGRVSDIILQPGETITSIAAGDTARWTVGDTSSGAGEGKRVHILVKPFSAGLATNLVIATDRRTYHLQLTSTPGTAMAGLSWTYPADELLAIRRKEAEDKAIAPVATGLDIQRLSFAYVMTGDAPAWRPLRAFDDGRQTFIEFPAGIGTGEAPPLFVIGEKGEAELVNYRMMGRFYVVDRLFGAAELRLGGKQQAVVRITRGAPEAGRHGGGRVS